MGQIRGLNGIYFLLTYFHIYVIMNCNKKHILYGGEQMDLDDVINFDKAPAIYWSNKLKCDYLQRQILVHSILYYQMNESVISDKQYDKLCKQLIRLSKKTKNYNETQYYNAFKDFTGETGFYLYDRLSNKCKTYLNMIASIVLWNYKGRKSDE